MGEYDGIATGLMIGFVLYCFMLCTPALSMVLAVWSIQSVHQYFIEHNELFMVLHILGVVFAVFCFGASTYTMYKYRKGFNLDKFTVNKKILIAIMSGTFIYLTYLYPQIMAYVILILACVAGTVFTCW
jgi:hypothetical protein